MDTALQQKPRVAAPPVYRPTNTPIAAPLVRSRAVDSLQGNGARRPPSAFPARRQETPPRPTASTLAATIQPKITYTVERKGLKQLTESFLKAAEQSGGVPGEIIATARRNDKFFLTINPQQLRKGAKGLTTIWFKPVGSQTFKEIHDMTPSDWESLQPTAMLKFDLHYDEDSSDRRMSEWYSLVHELGDHATHFWPLIKRVLAGTKAKRPPSRYFKAGGKLHQHTHHAHIAQESDPVFQKLFEDTYEFIRTQKPDKDWKLWDFRQEHAIDMLTQATLPIADLWDQLRAEDKPLLDQLLAPEMSQAGPQRLTELKRDTDNHRKKIEQFLDALRKILERFNRSGRSMWSMDAAARGRKTVEYWSKRADTYRGYSAQLSRAAQEAERDSALQRTLTDKLKTEGSLTYLDRVVLDVINEMYGNA